MYTIHYTLCIAIDPVGNGKQAHICSAAETFAIEYHMKITRKSTIFVDDDLDNIKIALMSDIRAIWLDHLQPEK